MKTGKLKMEQGMTMKKFTKNPVNAAQKPVKASDDHWEDANDLIVDAIDELGLYDEPAGSGSIAYDVFYNDDYEELGRIKSTQIEEYAASLLNLRQEVAVKHMKDYIKRICKLK